MNILNKDLRLFMFALIIIVIMDKYNNVCTLTYQYLIYRKP
jgi:hypothetical protein